MDEPVRGDLIVHYAFGEIRAISLVEDAARLAERPYDGERLPWAREGKLIVVSMEDLEVPVRLHDIPRELRSSAGTGSPFDRHGEVIVGYLWELQPDFVGWLLTHIGRDPAQIVSDSARIANPGRSGPIDYRGDTMRSVLQRGEQGQLRSILLAGAEDGVCALCGERYPKRFLVAAHIKARSKTSREERQDPNVAMLACLFGCDALFEHGFVVVNDLGNIIAGPFAKSLTGALAGQVRSLTTNDVDGGPRSLSARIDERLKYFRAHRREHDRAHREEVNLNA
jgi:hypothetical protein